MIDEANAHNVYKHLLKGHFDRYAIILEEKFNSLDVELSEWIQDTLLKIDFSREEMTLHRLQEEREQNERRTKEESGKHRSQKR